MSRDKRYIVFIVLAISLFIAYQIIGGVVVRNKCSLESINRYKDYFDPSIEDPRVSKMLLPRYEDCLKRYLIINIK